MAMFDEWWESAVKIPEQGKTCSASPCSKFAPSVCESTFEDFTDVSKSLIPEFQGDLLKRIVVESTLGGGKSGAYLFKVKIINADKVKSKQSFVIKIYATAYNSLDRVHDTRPFREVYTQCAMSGSAGYNCLLGFAKAPWSSVESMFAKTTTELYVKASLERNSKLADARMITELPASVLFMICTFSKGVPLLNLDLNQYGNYMPGIVLNIISTHQKADRRVGHFTHWDLHADNIFVDTGCENRSALPLAFIGEFDATNIWKRLEALTPDTEKGNLVAFKDEIWNSIIENTKEIIYKYKKTGKADSLRISADVLKLVSYTANQREAIKQLAYDFSVFVKRTIVYPTVTLIDFDLANSDQFPKIDRIHQAKLSSPLPVAERTMNWFLKWIPASHVIQFTQMLLSIRPLIAKDIQSDILHMLLYMIVALIYWELPNVPNATLYDRLARLHEKSNFVFTMVKGYISDASKLNGEGLQQFFLHSIKNVLPFKCEGPMYCGLAPLMAINYTNVNTALIGALRSCTESPQSLCEYSNLITSATSVFGDTKTTVTNLVKIVHGSLLNLNIQHFIKKGRFITSDDVELQLNHVPTDAKLYVHVEIPWAEFSKKHGLNGWLTGTVIDRYTKGRFTFVCNMTQDTNVGIRIKNGSDLVVSITSGMEFNVHGYGDGIPGSKYHMHISNSENIFVDGILYPGATRTNIIASIKFRSAKISVVGTLTEITVNFSFKTNLSWLSSDIVHRLLVSILTRYAPNNIVVSAASSGQDIKIVLSLPPSDDPLHPCVGFATDYTNLTHALNCLSSSFSMPSVISKLFDSLDLGTEPIFRTFLNEITASINLIENHITFPIPIWSMIWTETGIMRGEFELKDIPDDFITNGLTSYLGYYKGLVDDQNLPKMARSIYDNLPALSPWNKISTDATSFNVEYVKYLSSFLKEEEFHDAAD